MKSFDVKITEKSPGVTRKTIVDRPLIRTGAVFEEDMRISVEFVNDNVSVIFTGDDDWAQDLGEILIGMANKAREAKLRG